MFFKTEIDRRGANTLSRILLCTTFSCGDSERPLDTIITFVSATGEQIDITAGGNLSINYVTNTVTGTGSLNTTVPYRFNLNGVLDPTTGRISGTASFPGPDGISSSGSDSTGSFEGAAYGPSGVEVAILVTITRPDGTSLHGVLGWSCAAG